MSVPSMVHRSGDSLIVRSVVSGDPLFVTDEDDLVDVDLADDEKTLPECKIKRNYSCSNCDYFTQNPRHYLYHLRDVHDEKVKIYECPNCLYASKHFQKLLRHTKMVHGSMDGVEMPENSRGYKNRKRSADDELEDVDSDGDDDDVNKNSSFKCTMCSYTARNQGQLGKHEREEHIKAKYFKCNKCTYATNIKARFTKHTKYHSMPMIKCELCDFRTPYKWNLDRHCKNHNGSGAFKCSACNFTADIKQSLTVHEMNHHVPPVGQAAGLGVGRRRNKVGASDTVQTEEAAQVVRSSATDNISAASEADESGTPTTNINNNNNNHNNNNNNKIIIAEKKPLPRKIPPCKKAKSESNSAYGSDFIDPDDIIHHANGNIYIKNKCKLCNYKSAWDGEMAKHEEKVHNIVRTNGANTKPVKKAVRPIPNLIPIPSQAALTLKNPSRYYSPVLMMTAPPPAVSEPVYSQKDYNDICAKSANSDLKDLASLFGSEDMFKKPEKAEVSPNKIPDLIPAAMSQKFGDLKQKNASFFDKFKAKLTTNKLTCELCGHESKCLTESVSHQKSCGKEPAQIQYFNPVHTVSSTRCQYCRQRCKSSTDLLNHLQTCREALKQIRNIKSENGGVKIENDVGENEPHPMENRVFVWNNIEVPLDIEMESAEESQYEYVHETNKQDDNVSLDLSIRTHSPSSESSFVANQEIQQNSSSSVSEKIPTHGNDISVAQHKRVFKCPHCTFWASTASRFHVHIVGHLNRKPFECSLCSYRSNWRWDITKHIKLKSVRDPNHESAKVLMTDETGRRNYTKYNKYLTEINLSGEHNETCGGFGTRTKNHDPPSQVPLPNKTELPKLTRAPSSNDFRPLLRNQRPPPGLKAADEMFLAKLANEKKKSNADNKKTMWKCKKCNFRDASREKLLVHVRDHYPPRNVNEVSGNSTSANQDIDEASVGGGFARGQAPFQCGHCHQVSNWKHVIQRHCRLKHSGDIRVVIGTRSASEKMEIDDQIEEQDHVDLPQTGTFKCKQCPFSNNDNDIFEQHLEGHSASTSDRHHQCTLCLYNAYHRDELMDHLKLHGIPDPEEYLGRREKTSLDLEISKRYKCTECPYVTNSKSQFSYHKQFHKPKRGEYTCSTCGYNVSKRHLLHQHLKVHGFNPSSQKQNGDVVDLEEAADEIEEIIQSGSSSVDLQSCPDVPLVWVSKNGKFSKMYKCRYCPHVNLRKINIQEHEKMHGTREKNPNSLRLNDTEHKCPDCNYVCNNAGVLSSHSKVHQGLYGKIHGLVDLTKSDEEQISELSQFAVYQPSMDCVGFEDEDDGELSGELAQEPMEVSGDSIVYFCDKCPARFLKENEFYIHLRFHGARLIYKCNYCSYTARQKPHVLAHKNVHTEQYQERTKLFKETYCSHPDYPPPNVHAINDGENGTVYVVSEDDKTSLLEAEEPDSSFTPNKSIKSTFTVPLSGTELFQQKNQAQQNQRSSSETPEIESILSAPSISTPINDEPPFGGVMQGNPDFIYPTCIKNGRMKEKRYKCHKCPSAFEKRDQYKNHLTLHGAKQKYRCEICDYSVKYYANYTQHLKKHKNSSDALAAAKRLPEVVETLSKIDDDDEENDEDVGSSPKRPNIIAERRSSGNSVKDGDDKKLFHCSICPYMNHRKDAVDNHQKRHKSISGSSSTYTCEHCDYTVPQSHFLRDHCKLHFAQSKVTQPEGYMICDNIKLTSKKVDNDEKSSEDDVKSEENVIFEDRGGDDENRFDPPLKEEVLEQLTGGTDERIVVNPQTGEQSDKIKASTPPQLSGIDLSIVNRADNIDSHISSDT